MPLPLVVAHPPLPPTDPRPAAASQSTLMRHCASSPSLSIWVFWASDASCKILRGNLWVPITITYLFSPTDSESARRSRFSQLAWADSRPGTSPLSTCTKYSNTGRMQNPCLRYVSTGGRTQLYQCTLPRPASSLARSRFTPCASIWWTVEARLPNTGILAYLY